MTDLEIRQNFHRKKLYKYHTNKDSLVIDELGLNHGKSRADIAVINGYLIGYEIKSDKDSLARLKQQIKSYDSVFNKSYIIVGNRYNKIIHKYVPEYWGIIISEKNNNNVINFKLARKSYKNKKVKPISIARLLWRTEVIEILKNDKVPLKLLRQPREVLYKTLIEIYNEKEIQKLILKYLKNRKNWRYP